MNRTIPRAAVPTTGPVFLRVNVGPADGASQRWALLAGVNDYAALADLSYCCKDAETLAERLVASGFLPRNVFLMPGDAFEVLPHKALHDPDSRYSPGELTTSAVRGLRVKLATSEEEVEVPALALGRFCLRTGRVTTLRTTLVGTEDQRELGTAGGTAHLTPDEWRMATGRARPVSVRKRRLQGIRRRRPLRRPRVNLNSKQSRRSPS